MVMINTKIMFSCFELKTHVKNSMDYIYYFFAIFEVHIKLNAF